MAPEERASAVLAGGTNGTASVGSLVTPSRVGRGARAAVDAAALPSFGSSMATSSSREIPAERMAAGPLSPRAHTCPYSHPGASGSFPDTSGR